MEHQEVIEKIRKEPNENQDQLFRSISKWNSWERAIQANEEVNRIAEKEAGRIIGELQADAQLWQSSLEYLRTANLLRRVSKVGWLAIH